MDPWGSPGDILRWWRTDVLGWSQQQVAERLSVGSTALSNWEHGTRVISLDIEQVDRALEADGVLAGLLWSYGTPDGLEASRVWTKVFTGPSTPVWVWIRSRQPKVRLEAEWGFFRVERDLELGPNGLMVEVGASVSESPVVVQLSSPGWADFGRGELPRTIPGCPVLSAVDMVRPSTATGVFMDLFTADLEDRLRKSQAQERAATALSPSAVASFIASFRTARQRVENGPWPPVPEGIDTVDRARYAQLRRARALSLAQTVERLAAQTDITASKDTLRRFENDQGEPHDRLLPVALDHVLGADGHLALAELRSGQGPGVVRFPHYWHAPVWLALHGPEPETEIELHWGAWWRKLQGDLPLLLVCHHSDPLSSLRIVAGPRVRWTAGIGRPRGAVPINHGWVPTSVDAAKRSISDTQHAVLESIRRNT